MFDLNEFLNYSTNTKFLDIILFFFINIIIITIMRRSLTLKGIQLLMILNNLFLFGTSLYYSTSFILQYREECSNYKLNPNTWEGINCELLFKVNFLSFLFIFLVIVIGFATNIYLLSYFKQEERGEEFMLLINWFICSMLILLLANNFFTIILGWELIGLTSFLLINFWRSKVTTLGCSFKAFAFNKVSDVFLMVGFCILWNTFKTSNVDTLLVLITNNPTNNVHTLWCAGLCILIASCIKSAQFLGHLWLPDSMEAPVPASALIHSATLVSAGIYLLLKFYNIYVITDLLDFIFLLGSFTACFGGIVAASQTDLKKILAYSTISHCGFIMASLIFHNIIVTVVYLYLHGLFKALTFFCAGSIIKFNNTQDTRSMGMNKNQLFNTTLLIFSSINLGGLPFTFGYLYKFLFLQSIIIHPHNLVGFGLNVIGMLVSVVYVYKLIYYSCFDYRKGTYLQFNVYLQNIKVNVKSKFFTFSGVSVVAFGVLYMFAVIFYFSVKLYFLNNFVFFYYGGILSVNNYKYLISLLNNRMYLISFFYILFSTVILYLILWQSRENFFILEKLHMIVIILLIFGFYKFYNHLISFEVLSLMCRVGDHLSTFNLYDFALKLLDTIYSGFFFIAIWLKNWLRWYQSYSYWYGNPISIQIFYFVNYIFCKIIIIFDYIEFIFNYIKYLITCFIYTVIKSILWLFSTIFNLLFVKVCFYLDDNFFSTFITFDALVLRAFTYLWIFTKKLIWFITMVISVLYSMLCARIEKTINFVSDMLFIVLWWYSFFCYHILNFLPHIISGFAKTLTYVTSLYPNIFPDVFFLKIYPYVQFMVSFILNKFYLLLLYITYTMLWLIYIF